MSIILEHNGRRTVMKDINTPASSKRINFVERFSTVLWERPNSLHIRLSGNKISRIWFDYVAPPTENWSGYIYAKVFYLYATKLRPIKDSDGSHSGCVGFDITTTSVRIASYMTESEMMSIVSSLDIDSTSLIFCMKGGYSDSGSYWKSDVYQDKDDGNIIYSQCFRADVTTTIQNSEPIPTELYTEIRWILFVWHWVSYRNIGWTTRDEMEREGNQSSHYVTDSKEHPSTYVAGEIKDVCRSSDSGMDIPVVGGPVYRVTYKYSQAGFGSYTYNLTFNKEIL